MKFRPLHDRVDAEEKTVGGIIKEKPMEGVVVAAGSSAMDEAH